MIGICLELLLAIRYYSEDRTNPVEHPLINLTLLAKQLAYHIL